MTVSDAFANTAVCKVNVSVVDEIKPNYVGCETPELLNVEEMASGPVIVSWKPPTPCDNSCDGCTNCTFAANFTSHTPSQDVFPIGTTEVVYNATDASGNVGVCSFNVTVSFAAPEASKAEGQTAVIGGVAAGAAFFMVLFVAVYYARVRDIKKRNRPFNFDEVGLWCVSCGWGGV